jgi:putative acetyltransferase
MLRKAEGLSRSTHGVYAGSRIIKAAEQALAFAEGKAAKDDLVRSPKMQHSFVIRPVRPEDYPSMLALHVAAIMAISTAYYPRHIKESWKSGLTAERYGRALEEGEVFDIAADGKTDEPLAFCGCKGDQVFGFYVHPEAQGRGIGAALLRRGEERLRSWGVKRSPLRAALNATPFYARYGWRLVSVGHQITRGRAIMEVAWMEKDLG